ncbi:MAG: DUF433 domain-containing protein [Chloroflexota bacterium]
MESINLIASDPKVRRGRQHVVGTSVTVADVAIAHIYHNQDADGIAEWYALSLSQVYAALSFYYDHKSEIDEQIRAQIRHAEELEEIRIGNSAARGLNP